MRWGRTLSPTRAEELQPNGESCTARSVSQAAARAGHRLTSAWVAHCRDGDGGHARKTGGHGEGVGGVRARGWKLGSLVEERSNACSCASSQHQASSLQ